jgi:hypothetical protein
MSTWKPIQKEDLLESISNSEWIMGELARSLWELLRLRAPEKWHQSPWGNEGGGFWVVAVFGNFCIYFNDIEDGFNVSRYSRWGEIEEYYTNQLTLAELMESLAHDRLAANNSIRNLPVNPSPR